MLASNQNSREMCFRASLVLTLIAYQTVLTGCRSAVPAGRCGLPAPCTPTVMNDPFPNDQNVPPKGVDIAHYGYVRPQWRVLTSRESICCVESAPAIHTIFEQIPTPQQPTESMLPFQPSSASIPSAESGQPILAPATQYQLSTYGKASIAVTEFQPYHFPLGGSLLREPTTP